MKVTWNIIQHRHLEKESLEKICELKDAIWPYGMESQKDWISNNIKNNDFHILLMNKNSLIGYLTIVERDFIIDELNQTELLGIGNVCITLLHQRRGLGVQLLKIASEFILERGKSGALLCKDSLVDFYLRNNWVLVNNQKYGPNLKNLGVNLMTYKFGVDFKSIELLGQTF